MPRPKREPVKLGLPNHRNHLFRHITSKRSATFRGKLALCDVTSVADFLCHDFAFPLYLTLSLSPLFITMLD